MRRIIRQCIRGCTTLPHVGEHPGTGMVLFLIGIGCMIGHQGGQWFGAMVCGLLFAAMFLPMYLYGAYSRAQLSDGLESRADGRVKNEI